MKYTWKICFGVSVGENKKNVSVSKTFYYQNGKLVYCEMTVLRQGPHPSAEYTVKEYYWKNKRLAKISRNEFPVIEDQSLFRFHY